VELLGKFPDMTKCNLASGHVHQGLLYNFVCQIQRLAGSHTTYVQYSTSVGMSELLTQTILCNPIII
jgi:hypothetical protein